MSLPLGRLVTLRQERACHQPINKAASVSPSICVYLSGLEFPVEEMSSSPSIKRQALEGGLASLPPSPPSAPLVLFLYSPSLRKRLSA